MKLVKIVIVAIWVLMLGSFVAMIGTPKECLGEVFKWQEILELFGFMIMFAILVLVTYEEFSN